MENFSREMIAIRKSMILCEIKDVYGKLLKASIKLTESMRYNNKPEREIKWIIKILS